MGFMAPASVLGYIILEWKLSNAQAGWVGGALFVGYIMLVPFLTAVTDRVDPKRIYLFCAALGAAGNFGFAFIAYDLWTGVVFRMLTGIGLAGTFMPGLKALTDQLEEGKAQQRAATYYTSCFALGSGLSILVAGMAADFLEWRWAFILAGLGGLGAFCIILLVLPSKVPEPVSGSVFSVLDFRPIVRDREVMAYVTASFGVAWEVFTSRIWLVTFFFYLQARYSSVEVWLGPAVWSTIVALVGVPAAMVIGELSVRYNRRNILSSVAFVSCGFSVAIGYVIGSGYELSLLLCILFGITSYGRSAATTAGTVAVSDPKKRGGALAMQAFIGFSGGILGPLAFGIGLDFAGGNKVETAWITAMCVMAIGPFITLLSMFGIKKDSA